jgi:hypothetical protein
LDVPSLLLAAFPPLLAAAPPLLATTAERLSAASHFRRM